MKKRILFLGVLGMMCILLAACEKEAPAIPSKVSATVTPTPEPVEVSISQDGNVKAVITGNCFELEQFGLTFNPPTLVTIKEINSGTEEIQASAILASWPLQTPQVFVAVQDRPAEDITDEEFLEGLYETFALTAYEGGHPFSEESIVKKTVGGQEFDVIEHIYEKDHKQVHQDHYIMIEGEYALLVLIQYFDETAAWVPEVLDSFTISE